MNSMRGLRNRSSAWIRTPWVIGALAFLAGVFFGLVILGWWLWPVEYTGAAPDVMLQYYQLEYLNMTVDSFTLTGDANLARTRYEQLGSHGPQLLGELYNNTSANKSKLDQFISAVGATPSAGQPSGETTPAPSGAPAVSSMLWDAFSGAAIVILIFLVVIIGGIIAVVRLSRRRASGSSTFDDDLSFEAEEARSSTVTAGAQPAPATPMGEGQPLERFVTTYVLGDDLYEDSFTINSSSGEFQGECGVGISEPIGVGEPKKVTAFEIWLFDRKESKSSTTVLMSPYAFGKEDLKASLAPRGKPLLAQAGSDFWMETENLQLRVLVREIQFGKEPLPENSYFDRIMLQLEVWVK